MQASLSQLDASYIRIRHFVIILEETELWHGTLYVIKLLSELGHDIQSHGVSHKDLTTLSACDLEDEVGQSKQSLLEHDFNSTIFWPAYAASGRNSKIVDAISKY